MTAQGLAHATSVTSKSLMAETSKGPIEYTLLGDGPAVLVCHGTSSNCFSTGTSLPMVEAGFRVLTPSRPGYGRTPSRVGATASEAAEALEELLDRLAIRTCSVVAISGGGPTGLALAARPGNRVGRFILLEAISHPEVRADEPGYRSQASFYGPAHPLMWGMLRVMGRLAPARTARQTFSTFSTHDPDDVMRRLSPEEVRQTCAFFSGKSSRAGALNDFNHTAGEALLRQIRQPTLVVHSREDRAVPFHHAEWSLAHIPKAELFEGGATGHFFWIGPDFAGISRRMIQFLEAS